MSEELLFRTALAPAALLIWARYLAWPLALIGVSALIFFKIRPTEKWVSKLLIVQRVMITVAVLLSISLTAAYFMIPETDRQLGVFWYGALLGSLPVLLPAVSAIFLAPRKNISKFSKTRGF